MPTPDSSYTLFTDPGAIRDKAALLVALVRLGPSGPLVTETSATKLWDGAIGPAMLAKAAGTLESMMLLLPSHRSIDAFTLLRALFENAVVLSWIAADPGARATSWYRTSAYRELREHEDWMEAGMALQTPEDAKQLRLEAGSRSERLPVVSTMAQEADEHWGGVVPG